MKYHLKQRQIIFTLNHKCVSKINEIDYIYSCVNRIQFNSSSLFLSLEYLCIMYIHLNGMESALF